MKEQKNSTTSTLFAISFIISISILLFIGSLCYKQIKLQHETQNLTTRAFKVQILLEQLFSLAKDAETGQRGYIITKNTAFLEPYNQSRYKIDSIYSDLYLLTKDNAVQQQNLDSLNVLINLRFDLLKKRIAESGITAKNTDSIYEKMWIGKNVMNLLRIHLNKMISIETDLLQQNQKIIKTALSLTPMFFVGLFAFSILLFFASFYKTNKSLKNLKQVNDRLAETKIELEEKNKELTFQSEEKEKRSKELIIANKELAFQNEEKEKKAKELIIANKELAFQNKEKEKRAEELLVINKELSAFTYIASHDLQEPLRKTQLFISRIFDNAEQTLSEKNMDYFKKIQASASRMQILINDILDYSRVTEKTEKTEKLKNVDLNSIVQNVVQELTLAESIEETNTTINFGKLPEIEGIPFQLNQLFTNLINNSIKYLMSDRPPIIDIQSTVVLGKDIANIKADATKKYYKITVADNGMGFEQKYAERIFTLFQRLHDKQAFSGTGIGLTICKRIAENHNGFITATGVPDKGATFAIYFPTS